MCIFNVYNAQHDAKRSAVFKSEKVLLLRIFSASQIITSLRELFLVN